MAVPCVVVVVVIAGHKQEAGRGDGASLRTLTPVKRRRER